MKKKIELIILFLFRSMNCIVKTMAPKRKLFIHESSQNESARWLFVAATNLKWLAHIII